MSQQPDAAEMTGPGQKLRVVIAQMDFLVGDIPGNAQLVIDSVRRAESEMNADIVIFPELCLTGYPPEDLLLRPSMDLRVSEALDTLCKADLSAAFVIGAPIREGGLLFNSAVLIEQGEVRATYFKQFPPNYQVFDEKRYFASGDDTCVVNVRGVPVGLTVCEDIWRDGPVERSAEAGARLVININASPYDGGKQAKRKALLERKSAESSVSIV
ncbi:NAD+ synthase (glutamine-hydrolysing) [Marinobacter daqiaonensis]|uniref:NAD+ synthase (Glutamine-hydrolysing) n=1 Tax=Marinobacter daqiaonensis TaxID=650891 RepID=A0A1I6K669_9GAMM|nr:NAD+ synthase (glutamine-hydrolysing) [Marinobacter daqiaonensis]